jgi:hypothetical protein
MLWLRQEGGRWRGMRCEEDLGESRADSLLFRMGKGVQIGGNRRSGSNSLARSGRVTERRSQGMEEWVGGRGG